LLSDIIFIKTLYNVFYMHAFIVNTVVITFVW